jgi:hypothetical protein
MVRHVVLGKVAVVKKVVVARVAMVLARHLDRADRKVVDPEVPALKASVDPIRIECLIASTPMATTN